MKNVLTWIFALLLAAQLTAQTRAVTGIIKDERGDPVPFATVTEVGKSNAVQADANGRFTITVSDNAMVVITATGFKPSTVASKDASSIQLLRAAAELQEVVVTALGIKREKRTLTYATQSVSGDALARSKETNLVNALAGKVAGVQVSNSSGQAGSSARIVIRGNTSLTGNNQALFVIDGVPVDNNTLNGGQQSQVLYGNNGSNRIIDIDPSIIENLTVLRGTAGTALYGSLANAGVILITTKGASVLRGKIEPRVTLNSGITFEEAILPEFQNKYTLGVSGEYRDGITRKASTSWGAMVDTLLVNGAPVTLHDPRKDFFRRGTSYNNTISLDGATENVNYIFSYSNLFQQGIIPTNEFDRNSFYFKLLTKVSNKLNVNTSLNYVNSKNSRAVEGNSTNSYLWTIWGAPINWDLEPPLFADGAQNIYRTGRTNPLWTVENVRNNSKVNRFLPNITLAYSPSNWLTITNRTGADFYTDNKDFHEAIGSSARPAGRVYFEDIKSLILNNDLIAEAKKNVNKDLFISGLVGANMYYYNLVDNYVQGDGLSIANFYDISNAATITSTQSNINKRKLGVYALATAEYKRFLSLTITGRNDWSSAFYPTGKSSYFYPSASGAFVFTELLPRNNILSFGKLRLSYAEAGNDPPAYVTKTYFVPPSIGDAIRGQIIFPYNGVNTYTLNNISGNPNLKPERIKEKEIGLEAKLFGDRVNVDISLYDKKSIDLISRPELAGSTGFVSAYLNTGSIRNQGVEVTLAGTPVKLKDFTWDLTINWSKNNNKVLELSPGVQSVYLAGFTDPSISIYKDLPYGVIFGSKYARDDKTGEMLIDDDGYPLFLNDQGPLGYIQPKWLGGLVNTFSYKGLSLTAVMDYRKGGDILNFDNWYLAFYGTQKFTEDRERDYVVPGIRQSDGKPNTTPISAKNYFQTVYAGSGFDFVVEDGTFFKLRELSLNYDLPSRLFANKFIKGISVTASGRNLIIDAPHFTGADPEQNLFGDGVEGLVSSAQGFYHFITPPTRSYSFNLKVQF